MNKGVKKSIRKTHFISSFNDAPNPPLKSKNKDEIRWIS